MPNTINGWLVSQFIYLCKNINSMYIRFFLKDSQAVAVCVEVVKSVQ